MTAKRIVISAVLAIIGLPVVLVLIVIGSVAIANRTNGSLISAGAEREYLLYVPMSYDRAKPTPLVISLHAAMNWPAYQMKISQWNKAADDNGFIVVYPAGTGTGPKTWFMEGARSPSRMAGVAGTGLAGRTRQVTLVLLSYFLGVAAVYGALAHLTDSTQPSMALHVGGNVFSAAGLFLGGRSEWQLSSAPKPLIWEAGPDASFWVTLLALLVVGATAVWAYAYLSRVAHGLPSSAA